MVTIEIDNEISYISPLKLEVSDTFINLWKSGKRQSRKNC